MWPDHYHCSRPWWSWCPATEDWRRADGFTLRGTHFGDLDPWRPPAWSLLRAQAGCIYRDGETPETEPHIGSLEEVLARIDAAHPLPAPGPLPGQVWAFARPGYGDGWGYHLVTVAAAWIDGAWLVHLGGDSVTVATYREGGARPGESVWPLPGAILVYGPSQHGVNTPWSPV